MQSIDEAWKEVTNRFPPLSKTQGASAVHDKVANGLIFLFLFCWWRPFWSNKTSSILNFVEQLTIVRTLELVCVFFNLFIWLPSLPHCPSQIPILATKFSAWIINVWLPYRVTSLHSYLSDPPYWLCSQHFKSVKHSSLIYRHCYLIIHGFPLFLNMNHGSPSPQSHLRIGKINWSHPSLFTKIWVSVVTWTSVDDSALSSVHFICFDRAGFADFWTTHFAPTLYLIQNMDKPSLNFKFQL